MKDLIKYFEQIQPLSSKSKDAILDACTLRSVAKNEILEEFDSVSGYLYFLKSGIARIYYYKDGIEVTEYFAKEGTLVARVKSLLTGQASLKVMQMMIEGEVIAIHAEQFFGLFDEAPGIERLYRKILEGAYIEIVDRVEALQFNSPHERYAALLEDHDLIQNIPLKHLASYLGVTPESLSRIRARHQVKASSNTKTKSA